MDFIVCTSCNFNDLLAQTSQPSSINASSRSARTGLFTIVCIIRAYLEYGQLMAQSTMWRVSITSCPVCPGRLGMISSPLARRESSFDHRGLSRLSGRRGICLAKTMMLAKHFKAQWPTYLRQTQQQMWLSHRRTSPRCAVLPQVS
jgi:hypothetical protein